MSLSILEASRFVLSTAIMRADFHAKNKEMSFDHIAALAVVSNSTQSKLRPALEALADNEEAKGYLRRTPSHAQSTERVMASRKFEFDAFNAVGDAVIQTIEYGDQLRSDRVVQSTLTEAYARAFDAIDSVPGTEGERLKLVETMMNEISMVSPDKAMTNELLAQGQDAALQAARERLIARFMPESSPSNDNEFSM